MKRRKTTRTRKTTKSRKSRAIRPNLRNGTGGCDIFGCITKAFSPVLKILGVK